MRDTLIDREDETNKILNEIKTAEQSFVKILSSPTGVGKSALVLKLIEKIENLKQDYTNLKLEYSKVKNNNNWLKHCLSKTFEYVSILFDFPIDRLKKLVNDYIIKENKENEKIRTR